MTSDLCDEDVGRITSQQIISSDALVSTLPLGTCVGASAPASRVAASTAAVDLGRRLLLAARAGETAAVFDLMAKGAPFTTDWLGTSPLHLAAANGHVQTCSVLLRAGVTRDSRTKVERTPLHLAAHAGHADVVTLLLDHGAIVDCRDMLRMTPLHWAAARGHEAAARALLRRGADPRLRCKFRHTPRALAARRGHAALVQLLDQALLDPSTPALTPTLTPTTNATAANVTPQPVFTDQVVEEARKAFGIDTLTKTPEIKIDRPKIKIHKDALKQVKPEPKPEQQQEEQHVDGEGGAAGAEGGAAGAEGGGEGGVGGAEGAAALLRRHGITLLPHDDHSTVLNAIQSGRTVVLSDAGKLMLKESEVPMDIPVEPVNVKMSIPSTTTIEGSTGASTAVGVGGGGGMVIRATPVRTPPRGVKVFSVNNKLLLPATGTTTPIAKIPVKKIINPQDLQQMKFVQLSSESTSLDNLQVKNISMKAKNKVRPAPVKIFMNKTNFTKLIANANKGSVSLPATFNGTEISTETESAPTQVQLQFSSPPEESSAEEVKQLRAQLAAARAALAAAAAELRAARDKLAAYESAHHD